MSIGIDLQTRQFTVDPLLLQGKKSCTKCKTVKPVSDFYKHNQHGRPGLRAFCKICSLELHRENNRAFKLMQTTGTMKTCRTCEDMKPLTDFYFKIPDCKQCSGVKMKAYRKKHAGKINQHQKDMYRANKKERRELKLKEAYGITQIEYNEIFILQDGRCAICEKHQSDCKYAMGVDHDHKTGEIRGLLCSACNRGIGMLSDDIEKLKRAIAYLERTR